MTLRRDSWPLFGAAALLLALYAWTAGGGRSPAFGAAGQGRYDLLAQALLRGQLHLTVDPEGAVVEHDEGNNDVRRTVVVQDPDLFLTAPFFSPNGDGVQDTTTLAWRTAEPAQVAVSDSRGQPVRTLVAVGEAAFRALLFPLATTLAAMVAVALWGETLLALFGPEFAGATLPLLILMACQLARALFGPSVPLLTVIGAQKENAALALATLAVLAAGDLALAPLYGVLGAAIAVAIATLFWLAASAVVLMRLSGLRTDALYLLGRLGSPHKASV